MKKLSILLLSVTGLLFVASFVTELRKNSAADSHIMLNEICSFNGFIIRDGVNDCSDYIELYNPSEQTVSLAGWYLSDDETSPKKYALTEGNIEPGGFFVFYANGTAGGQNLPFKINEAGEKIFLCDPQGNIVDHVAVPELGLNETYARICDGDSTWEIKEATYLSENIQGKSIREKVLESPQFSAGSGFYEDAFYLTLQAGADEKIYYTLDGSIPDENSHLYEGPIFVQDRSGEPNRVVSEQKVVKNWKDYAPEEKPVDKATVVRAIAVNEKGEISETATETYFVNLPQYEDSLVISLTADPEMLFGSNGIFATGEAYDQWYENGAAGAEPLPNFFRRGRSWEVEANMEYFENGRLMSNHAVGVRAQGNSGRSQAFKRMSLFAREEYAGSEYFNESVVGREVHSLMTNEYVSNVVLPYLVTDRDVAVQESAEEPVVLFLNGEYYYTRYVMEKYSGAYMEEIFGVNPDNVIFMKNNQVDMGNPEDEGWFRGMQALAADESLSPDEKYEKLSQVIDIQSFIDYFSINVYLCNMNMNEVENYLLWRTREPENGEYGDTKWRWVIYDVEPLESLRLEYYGFEERAQINSFTHPQDWTGFVLNENSIYQGLKDCEIFRKQFVLTFLDLANVNFAPERVEPILASYGLDLTWLENFFLHRFDYIVEDLKEEFSLTGTLETVTLQVNDPAGGTIHLNTTVPDLSDGAWSGRYYTDFPVTVTAVPSEGYRFAGWTGDLEGTGSVQEVPVISGGIRLCAVFEKI